MEEGTRSGAIYFLKSGRVEIVRGEVVLGDMSKPGSTIGEVSMLLGRPHVASVRAAEPCVCCVAEDAEAFLRDHPEVNLVIARELAWKVDAMSCYLADLKHQFAEEKGHLGMVGEVLDTLLHRAG